MPKPTDSDLEITRNTIAYLEANMEEKEPHATCTIASFNDVYHNLPDSSDEIDDHE